MQRCKRFINIHKEYVCQEVLQKQFPGIEFKKFLEGELECHFMAYQNPLKNSYLWLPKLDVKNVLEEIDKK